MANLKASKKYIPINKRNRERNIKFKSALKTHIKKALEAISSDKKDKVTIVRVALRAIAKVRQKGIIHKNYANRMKSKLSTKLNTPPVKGTPSEPKKGKAEKETKKPAAKKAVKSKIKTIKKLSTEAPSKKSPSTKIEKKSAPEKKVPTKASTLDKASSTKEVKKTEEKEATK